MSQVPTRDCIALKPSVYATTQLTARPYRQHQHHATSLANQTKCSGDSVTFSTTASGTGPFSFVWKKNNTAILNATNSPLSIPSLQTNDAGSYCVEVTGACNSVTNCRHAEREPRHYDHSAGQLRELPGDPSLSAQAQAALRPFSYVGRRIIS